MREAALVHGFSMPFASADPNTTCGCAGVGPAAVELWGPPTAHRRVFFREGSLPSRRAPSSPAFGKPIQRQEMDEMFEPATFLGLAAVAIWVYVRYPRSPAVARLGGPPRRDLVHRLLLTTGDAGPSTAARTPRPPRGSSSRWRSSSRRLTYVLLSWVWLIARIVELLGGTPRGGHPVTHEH